MMETVVWVLLVTAGSAYVLASGLLFLFGTNLTVLSLTTMRHGSGSLTKSGKGGSIELSDNLPMVTVQLPIYNELYVAARIISSVAELDYPQDRLLDWLTRRDPQTTRP